MVACAIHQPNFFPWAGYFSKIDKADIFIFLDAVDYPKSGSGAGSWCNRVKLLNSGVASWFGLPVKRTHGAQLIKDVEFSNKDYHVGKFLKSLEHNYKKFAGYQKYFNCIHALITYQTNSLAEYNINAITQISRLLKLNTKLIRQSELPYTQSSTELLIELVQAVNADTYICGGGASGYQEDELFTNNKIKLQYQRYNPLEDHLFTINNEIDGSLSILNHIFKLLVSEEADAGSK